MAPSLRSLAVLAALATVPLIASAQTASAQDSAAQSLAMMGKLIAMSPDGRSQVRRAADGRIDAWNVAKQQRHFVFSADKLGVTALAGSADGKMAATGSRDNSTKLGNAANGDLLGVFNAPNRPVEQWPFRDGKTMGAGSCTQRIIFLQRRAAQACRGPAPLVRKSVGFEQEERLLHFSPDSSIGGCAR